MVCWCRRSSCATNRRAVLHISPSSAAQTSQSSGKSNNSSPLPPIAAGRWQDRPTRSAANRCFTVFVFVLGRPNGNVADVFHGQYHGGSCPLSSGQAKKPYSQTQVLLHSTQAMLWRAHPPRQLIRSF